MLELWTSELLAQSNLYNIYNILAHDEFMLLSRVLTLFSTDHINIIHVCNMYRTYNA